MSQHHASSAAASMFAAQNYDSLARSISRYAWVVNYYDNWEMGCLIEDVYANFQALPEPDEDGTGNGDVMRQLPGYTVESAMAKEIYERAFNCSIPLPSTEAASEAERAGQVYCRSPSTFYQDLRPRLSGPANSYLIDNLQQRLCQAVQHRLASKIRNFWDLRGEEAERVATEWAIRASRAPGDYFEALEISNGIYGMGLTPVTMLDSVEDVLTQVENFDGGGPTLPDAVKADRQEIILDSFKIASSPGHNAWYCVEMVLQEPNAPPTPIWELVWIHGYDEAVGTARDIKTYLRSWSETMLQSMKESGS